jgi:flagellar export protein FliJ
MKKFRFRLDSLLAYRRTLRDRLMAEWSRAVQAETVLQERIAELESELEQRRQESLAASSPGVVSPDRLLGLQRRIAHLKIEAFGVRGNLEKIKEETARRLVRYQQAETAVRALEKLEERKRDDWRRETLAEEDRLAEETWRARQAIQGFAET